MFKSVLVANRGEIAVRIIRECRIQGMETIAIYSDCDATALHVKLADKSVRIGSADPGDSYLNIEKVIRIATENGVDAVHPGYGFISDNWNFAAGCEEAGISFIGPSPKTLAVVANKVDFKKLVKKIGVPIIEGSDEVIDELEEAKSVASEIGYPVLLKSAFGGGGRGIRRVKDEAELVENFTVASNETRRAFGRAGMYIEKLVSPARHIEVQIVSDGRGNTIHLGERECSIQRRHQKLLELAPSPAVDEESREKIGRYAITIAEAVNYKNVGTVEFLMDSQGRFYFIEVNARLQVEHPITEAVTGIDLVREQLAIAAGEKMSRTQRDVELKGAAIQCRINAEDPAAGFIPSAGEILKLFLPGGPGVRIDTALYPGYVVPEYYDSLLAKVITFGASLEEARRRMVLALDELRIDGVKTTISLHQLLLAHEEFQKWNLDVSFLEKSGVLESLVETRKQERQTILEEGAIMAAAVIAIEGSGPQAKRGVARAGIRTQDDMRSRFHDLT